jgi:DNA-binding NarL/FixJ family response regulator
MKSTRIDNPEIIVKDSRILELDEIVTEVKCSEEWEAVKMNILEVGIQQGLQQGLWQKLVEQVGKKLEKGFSVPEIADMLEESEKTIEKVIEEMKKRSNGIQ